MEQVTVVAVKNMDPIFSASITPAMVDMILSRPPNQAHQGTCAALPGANPLSCVKGTAMSNAIRALLYTQSAANKDGSSDFRSCALAPAWTALNDPAATTNR